MKQRRVKGRRGSSEGQDDIGKEEEKLQVKRMIVDQEGVKSER